MMHLVTWNVNGLRAIMKKNFTEMVREINPDVLCLQETKASHDEILHALSEFTDFHIYTNTAEKKGYSGTTLLSKTAPEKVSYGIGIEKHDKEGRVITAEFIDFFLVNVYVPNSGQKLVRLDYRKQWDTDFRNYLLKLTSQKPVIVCGDLNVAHQAIDLKNDKSNYNKTAGYTQVEIDGFTRLLEAGFVDVFRNFYPNDVTYSYWSYRFNARARNTGWRIDYFLVSKTLINSVKEVEILTQYFGSDHCPVSLKIS